MRRIAALNCEMRSCRASISDEARTLRQQARASGMDPDYWYAVEEVSRIKPETVVEVVFWKRSIALYRAKDGSFHAMDNRCAHRQLRLSLV